MTLTGFVDVYKPTVIDGWAWDIEHPEAFVDVEILRDGSPLARVTAGAYRDDLSESELHGAHGYWSRQLDAARAEFAGALQAKEEISLELHARTREASDLAQAVAEQGRQREQAELALAREKSLNVEFYCSLISG